jgi:hypothetical protein
MAMRNNNNITPFSELKKTRWPLVMMLAIGFVGIEARLLGANNPYLIRKSTRKNNGQSFRG